MRYAERERIIKLVPYESKLGYIAFCVERCLKEARRHPAAAAQLERLPLLGQGLQLLWDRAERGAVPDPARIAAVREHLRMYRQADADGENDVFAYDVALVCAAGELLGGLLFVEDPTALDAGEVARALEGPDEAVGSIYQNADDAQDAEVEVIDQALQRLKKWGDRPFSREVFADLPEWKRGKLSKKYASGQLTGTDVNRDD